MNHKFFKATMLSSRTLIELTNKLKLFNNNISNNFVNNNNMMMMTTIRTAATRTTIGSFLRKNLFMFNGNDNINNNANNLSIPITSKNVIATRKTTKFVSTSPPLTFKQRQNEEQQPLLLQQFNNNIKIIDKIYNNNLINKRNFNSLNLFKNHQRNLYTSATVPNFSKFNSAVRDPHHTASLGPTTPLNEDRAYELVLTLNDTERSAVKKALDKYDAMRIKQGFEGELAAHKWRSRFGRPAKIPAFNSDPTGSYCAIPVDWLKQKLAEKAQPPSTQDLWKIFMVNAVPFIGFGFLDNFTMIIAGDYIEQIFGTFMCISTMAAAGFGNTISDVLGIGSAYYVERGCEMLGLRAPDLTPIQMDMKSSRRAGNMGRIFGITAGCLIGMFPLLFMENTKKKDEADKE